MTGKCLVWACYHIDAKADLAKNVSSCIQGELSVFLLFKECFDGGFVQCYQRKNTKRRPQRKVQAMKDGTNDAQSFSFSILQTNSSENF